MFTNWQFTRSATPLGVVLFSAVILASAGSATAAKRVTTDGQSASGASERLTSAEATTAEVTIALREPEVARARKRNRFAVTLESSAGAPVSDADVRLTLYRAGTPGPKGFFEFPLQSAVQLREGERSGTYEGIGAIPVGGAWQVTVTVDRHGNRLAKKTMKLWAR